jgi:ribosome biogenesis GTPase
MELTHLGYDDWFDQHAETCRQPERVVARVTAVDRDAFLVRRADGEIYAELAGRFRFEIRSAVDLPCVGDWVFVAWPESDGTAIIHEVLKRRTFLRRKAAGRIVDYQMIAANIDVVFLVQGCHYDFNLRRLERYLVAAHDGGIEPEIILTKTDLVSPAEVEEQIAAIRAASIEAPILAISNVDGSGLDAFRERLVPGRTYCLLGSSGVGKTTLINRLLGREELLTRSVSETGEGVHTTSRRQLRLLDGGALLIDTPGMREFGLIGTDDGVETNFAEIAALSGHCRFPDCSHLHEPGCAVLAALAAGEIEEDRYQSYLKLRKEAAYHGMSYVERRRKDRSFGRLVKKVLKLKRPKG